MITGIVVIGWMHFKNIRGLQIFKEKTGIDVVFGSIALEKDLVKGGKFYDYNVIISSDGQINPTKYPEKLVITGPHIGIEHLLANKHLFAGHIFNALAKWIIDLLEFNYKTHNVKLVAIPFPVDLERFTPLEPDYSKRTEAFVYIKARHPAVIQAIFNKINESPMSQYIITTFNYGSYKEEDYKKC